MTSIKKPFNPIDDVATEFEDDDESNSDEDERLFLERFLKKCRQHQSRKKRTNALVLEAQQLINELQHGVLRKKFLAKKRSLKGGAIGLENTSRPKKKKSENPLKKELSNPLCESSRCTNSSTSKSRNVTSKRHDQGSCKT